MQSLILSTATRYLMPLMILFSIFIELRGHNEPGGGFIGGLIASAAFALYGIAFGIEEAQRLLRVNPRVLIGVGLLLALVSGLIGVLAGDGFMKGLWLAREFPVLHKLGTPLLFDIGVYLAVIGVTLLIIFSLSEDYLRETERQEERA